jgi:predicted site-specific integrase-resolvase
MNKLKKQPTVVNGFWCMTWREKKYEEELAEDIMKILTCYSARYYGARGGRKKKIEVVESNAI